MFWYELLQVNKLDEGSVVNINKGQFVIKNNILRDIAVYSPNQKQTEQTFGYKWSRRDTYESEAVQINAFNWLKDRYVDGD